MADKNLKMQIRGVNKNKDKKKGNKEESRNERN